MGRPQGRLTAFESVHAPPRGFQRLHQEAPEPQPMFSEWN